MPRPVVKSLNRAVRSALTAVPSGAANSLFLFVAIVAAVTLAGAGPADSQAGGGSTRPLPSQDAPAPTSPADEYLGAAIAAVPPMAAPAPTETFGKASPAKPSIQPALTTICVPSAGTSCPAGPAPTPLPPLAGGANPMTKFHVPIFEYHRVKPPAGETGYVASLIVPPAIFAEQMGAMAAAGWHTITMGELGDDMSRGIQPARKSFVISFDDGYEDGYTYALPVLQRYGFVATYFVVAGRIDTAQHLTVAELRALVAAGNEIGNHTVSHKDLEAMTPDQMNGEIDGASATIAGDVGVWPQSFAYPLGLTDATVIAAVAAAPGIETAVLETGSKPETWANRLVLPRIRVGPGSYPQDLLARADRYLQ